MPFPCRERGQEGGRRLLFDVVEFFSWYVVFSWFVIAEKKDASKLKMKNKKPKVFLIFLLFVAEEGTLG